MMLKKLIKRIIKSSNSTNDAFSMHYDIAELSTDAVNAAKLIRGIDKKPAIIIHGVMPRSGTVYLGEVLSLHPNLDAYPNNIWEIPLLLTTGDLIKVQKKFFKEGSAYNSKIGENDLLALFGSSFIGYLYSLAPIGKQILLKVPNVQYLNYFFTLFPHEYLLLVIRDGRDVVNSTIKTWPERDFSDVCKLWNDSMKMILSFRNQCSNKMNRCWIAKYEDCVLDPVFFVKNACKRLQLDENKYPFRKIKKIFVHGSSSLKSDGQVTWNGIIKPNNFNPIGHWQKWSAGKKKIFKRIAGRTLIDSGYCDDLDW